MPVYKPGYSSKPTISIYDKDGSINDKELDPEIKVGAIYKIVDVERNANGQKIYVLCQTSGEIIKNNQDNVISLVDHGYIINAWLRHRKSSKIDSFNRYKNVEIVVTNLDSIKGAPPNIESKIVIGKDQTIERLKSFEIIARYNRKESLLGRKQNLEFDILKDGSIRIYSLLDNNVEEVKIPSFVRYLKRELFRNSQVSRIYYDNDDENHKCYVRSCNVVTDPFGKTHRTLNNMLKYYDISKSSYFGYIITGRTLKDLLIDKMNGRVQKFRKGSGSYIVVDHLGKTYDGLTDMCRHYGIAASTLRYRLLFGWTLETALTYPAKDVNTEAKLVEDHLGNKYTSVSDMCRHYNINLTTYITRIKAGRTLEKALTTPVKPKKKYNRD